MVLQKSVLDSKTINPKHTFMNTPNITSASKWFKTDLNINLLTEMLFKG